VLLSQRGIIYGSEKPDGHSINTDAQCQPDAAPFPGPVHAIPTPLQKHTATSFRTLTKAYCCNHQLRRVNYDQFNINAN
jgi:hypothetical protein